MVFTAIRLAQEFQPDIVALTFGLHSRERLNDANMVHSADAGTLAGDVRGAAASPETSLERSVTAERLRDALEALPAEYRETLVLRELEGLSYKEIASIADVPIGTVMSRLARARKQLRKHLDLEREVS